MWPGTWRTSRDGGRTARAARPGRGAIGPFAAHMAGIRCGDTPGFAVALMIDGGFVLREATSSPRAMTRTGALAIRDRCWDNHHYAEAQAGLATALAGTGESAEAIAAALQAEETEESISRRPALPARAPVSDLRRDSTQGARPRDVSRGDRLRGGRPRVRPLVRAAHSSSTKWPRGTG